jgi:hypothetical protein
MNPTLEANIEQLLIKFVLPELSSANEILKNRALDVYCKFEALKLQSESHIKQLVDAIY